MYYLKILLLRLRQEYAKQDGKLSIIAKLLIAFVVLVAVSIPIDIFLDYNVWVNTLRALIAVVFSLVIFSLAYLFAMIQAHTNSTKGDYVPWRERFSQMQRINISALLGIVLFIAMLILPTHTPVYTILSSIILACGLGLLAFVRTYKNEYIKKLYNIPDPRDVKFKRELELKRKLESDKEIKSDED